MKKTDLTEKHTGFYSGAEVRRMKKPELDANDMSRYVASGIAAYLPGAQMMLDWMQERLDELRADLRAFQQMEPAAAKRGRPAAVKGAKLDARGTSWAGMSEEERSAEMKRRRALGERNKAAKAKLHPRDAAHPEHAAWREKMRAAQQKRWASLSPAQKKQQQRNMAKARAAQAATARGAVEEMRATA